MGEHLGDAHDAPRHGSPYGVIFTEDPITPNNRCKHRFAGIRTIVVARAEGGVAARCLLCAAVGPARANGEDARHALSNETVRDEEQLAATELVGSYSPSYLEEVFSKTQGFRHSACGELCWQVTANTYRDPVGAQ